MFAFPERVRHGLITVWTLAVLVFVFLPGVTILLASLTASRYFTFPIPKWGFEWWYKTFSSFEVRQLLATSLSIAGVVMSSKDSGEITPSPRFRSTRRKAARSSTVPACEPSPVPVSSQVAGTQGSSRRAGLSSKSRS